jgi:hypothetical protein
MLGWIITMNMESRMVSEREMRLTCVCTAVAVFAQDAGPRNLLSLLYSLDGIILMSYKKSSQSEDIIQYRP